MNSPFHEQAVRDVAEATGWSAEAVADLIRKIDGEDGTQARDLEYAVSQRERVLQLDSFFGEFLKAACTILSVDQLNEVCGKALEIWAASAPEKEKP